MSLIDELMAVGLVRVFTRNFLIKDLALPMNISKFLSLWLLLKCLHLFDLEGKSK